MGQITRTNFGLSSRGSFIDAQIKQLPVTHAGAGGILIPAITGSVIQPVAISFILSPWVANYTNIDGAANISLNIAAAFPTAVLTGAGLLAQGHANILWCDYLREWDFTPVNYGTIVSQPLRLVVTNAAAGAFTAGNATQVLYWQVFYNTLRID